MFRILLADDDESLRQLLAHNLKLDLSAVVDVAGSGNEAIKLIKQGAKYSLIISDYNMPDGNGAVLQDFLVENNIQSYFFFYTSETQVKVNQSHQKFVSIIQKPNIEQLFTELVFKICTSNLKKNGLAF